MRVLAVDPGNATGMAVYDTSSQEFSCWVESDPMNALTYVSRRAFNLDVVVVEDYRISGSRGKEANQTIEIIGAIKWLGYYNTVTVVMQEPGSGQRFAGKHWEKLKIMGWYEKASVDHHRSAAAHLLLYLVKAGLIEPSLLLHS